MLRITTVTHAPDRVVLKLEGWVSGTNVGFLEKEGTCCLQSGARLVLELSGVRFIDGKGLALLRGWSRSQLTLQGGSAFVRRLLEEQGLGTSSVGGTNPCRPSEAEDEDEP